MVYSHNEYDNNLTFTYLENSSGNEFALNQTIDFEKDMILAILNHMQCLIYI